MHNVPGDEICNCADAENDHVGSGLAFETEEGESSALTSCIVEEFTRTLVDAERSETAHHLADTCDGSDARLREHITNGRIKVGRPSLVTSTCQTDDDSRPPSAVGAKRLGKEGEDGEERKDQHCTHTS